MAESADAITSAPFSSESSTERKGSDEVLRENEEDFFDQEHLNIYKIRRDHKLGRFSVFCIIVNRMIGTGIFEQPATVLAGCGSLGGSLFVWMIGALVAFSGLMVHIEYGLVIPRHINRIGQWVCFPRSGGEKNYFEFLFRRQKLLPVCIYGVIFVFLGNTAGNSIICADHFLLMVGTSHPDQNEWLMKGLALAIITLACLMHTLSRTVGIYIINTLAVFKIMILWGVIILALIARAGVFDKEASEGPPAWSGLEPAQAFQGSPGGIYGWTIAILSVLFAFGGYENANYVLGEIKNPKQNFPPAAIFAVFLVSVSYVLTIIAYYIVIPAAEMLPGGGNTAPKPVLLFFEKIFDSSAAVQRTTAGLIALSSFGNLMTVTFIAARVKQEIAKEGIIYPYSFWRKEYNNLGLTIYSKLSRKPINIEEHEKTPIPALFLHWVTSAILITAPPLSIAYTLFSRMQAYMIQACFGSILGFGLLYLRYFKPYIDSRFRWILLADRAFDEWKGVRWFWLHWMLRPNFVFPLFYSLGMFFLVIGPWIQPGDSGESRIPRSNSLKWFVFPTVCLCLFPLGVVYWLIYEIIWPWGWKRKLVRGRRVDSGRNGNSDWEGVKAEWVPTNSKEADEDDGEDPDLPSLKPRPRGMNSPA